MPNETERLWLLFNGEVYNHDQLRKELRTRGHEFATRCDAEVVVHGYEEWGDDIFPRLNGMWALALADADTEELVLARDARGIKPLIRTTGLEPFSFASDAFALAAAGLVDAEIDREAIAEFLAFHYVPPPRTGVLGLEQVDPGTIVHRRADGREHIVRWARPLFGAPERKVQPVSLTEARETISQAVARQLRADVEVGVFLSGGIDSALMLKYAVDAGARPVAYTLGFANAGDYDESVAAAGVARALGVEHRVEPMRTDFTDTVAQIGDAFDSPFADPSAIATLPLARLARRDVTAVLSGTGGDDLFGGYYRHRALRLRRLANNIPSPIRNALMQVAVKRGEERKSLATLAFSYFTRLIEASSIDDRDLYLSLVGRSTSRRATDLVYDGADLGAAREDVARRHGLAAGCGLTLDDIQNFELSTYLSGDLLVKEDRATMACGLEGRVPFLDNEVAAVAARSPASQRARFLAGKVLIRKLARRELAPRLAATRKRGFAVPLGLLFRGPWRGEAISWLRDCQSNLFDPSAAALLAENPHSPPLDVWTLIALSAWERQLGEHRRAGAQMLRAGRSYDGMD